MPAVEAGRASTKSRLDRPVISKT